MTDDRSYLLHIRDAIERIQQYTRDGEEVKRLSSEATSQHGDIPWKQIAGMRDVLIHHYFGVKLDTVWEVVERHLAPLATGVHTACRCEHRHRGVTRLTDGQEETPAPRWRAGGEIAGTGLEVCVDFRGKTYILALAGDSRGIISVERP